MVIPFLRSALILPKKKKSALISFSHFVLLKCEKDINAFGYICGDTH